MRIVSVIKKHTSEFSIPLTMMKDDTIEGEKRERNGEDGSGVKMTLTFLGGCQNHI